jgi:NitT/TauT family transport system substrate-binding protein
VPFAELFPHRSFARKIYDGSQAKAPTMHGSLVEADYAKKYPEIVVAYLRAAIEADRLIAAEPEKYSALIETVTGIEAEVNYLFHGPVGLQTRDFTWKPEYRQAVGTSIETLRLLKRTDKDLDVNTFIDDHYIRTAFQQAGLDYDRQLKNYDKLPLKARDAVSGKQITDFRHLTQIWVQGEALVRHYASAATAFEELRKLEAAGKKVRTVYAHDQNTGLKLLAGDAWFVVAGKEISAFLLRADAQAWATKNKGSVVNFDRLKSGQSI